MKPSAPRCTPFRALPWPAKANALGLGLAAVAITFLLWPLWIHDDNLTHGAFLPILSGILFVESRRDPDPRFLRAGPGLVAACLLLLVASLGSFAVALVYAAALGLTHAVVEFLLVLAFVFALAAAWLGFADGRVRFLPFSWSAGVAVGLGIFASPPPPGSYARLALFLQGKVTVGVGHALDLLGVAAYRDGNVIELARTSVGVSEACSGVRSLISCTVAGLFLSALLVRRPRHRALLIVLSPAIGLAMNFLRSLCLTLLANAGVDIEGLWHDLTGASILAITTILVAALALRFRRREAVPETAAPSEARTTPLGRSPLPGMATLALALIAGTAAVLAVAAGSSRAAATGPAPDLAALLPPPSAGWATRTTPGMDQYSGILHTHALIEQVYWSKASPTWVTFYLAYWRPGQAPVSLVDAHTPDACWPGTGWEPRPMRHDRVSIGIGDRILAPAECRLFAHEQAETHVWFWHLYGGQPLTLVDPYSVTRLLKLSWRYGLDHSKDQLFVRVSSNRSWEEIRTQPVLRQFFARLAPLGL